MNKNLAEETPYLGAVLIILCPIGIIGNLLTLIIIKRRGAFKSRSQMRLYFGNLAAADLASSLHWLAASMGYMDIKLANATIICHFISVTRRPLTVVTLLSLTILSLNRYCAVAKPDKVDTLFSEKKSRLYIIAIWTLTLVSLVIPLLYGNRAFFYSNLLGTCWYRDNIATMVLISLVVACIIIMVYCNVKTWCTVRQHNMAMSDREVITAEVSRERNIKMNRITSIIVVTFIISYGLGLILAALGRQLPAFWARMFYVVYVSNFANNVFIYGALDKDYRKDVKRIVFICKVTQSGVSPTNADYVQGTTVRSQYKELRDNELHGIKN